MKKNRKRKNKVWQAINRLLAALALVAFFSCPGTAAIKRFTDEKGTLHISNEGGEGKPPTPLTSPLKRPSRVRNPRGLPQPGVAPPQPRRPAPPEPEDRSEEIDEAEEMADEPEPPAMPGGPR